jgi:hypothetical protein
MEIEHSLLGQFYSRIRGSQEDIATEGINYILNRSSLARQGIRSLIYQNLGFELPEIHYRTQATGENLERPDIVGTTTDGKELLIIESKFWAALTDNQPNEYLNRLKHHNAVLLFVCPNLRVRSLWEELNERIKSYSTNTLINQDKHQIHIDDQKHVLICTWAQILGTVKENLIQGNEYNLISDINQIIGFCNTIDRNTFLPITSEDLSPKFAKRLSSYYNLVDKVLDEMKKLIPVDLSGMKATPQKNGYCRYLKVNDLGLSLMLNFDLWAQDADTPFWIGFQRVNTPSWIVDEGIKNKVHASKGLFRNFAYLNSQVPHYPLIPMVNVPEEEVIRDMAKQAVDIINFFT